MKDSGEELSVETGYHAVVLAGEAVISPVVPSFTENQSFVTNTTQDN